MFLSLVFIRIDNWVFVSESRLLHFKGIWIHSRSLNFKFKQLNWFYPPQSWGSALRSYFIGCKEHSILLWLFVLFIAPRLVVQSDNIPWYALAIYVLVYFFFAPTTFSQISFIKATLAYLGMKESSLLIFSIIRNFNCQYKSWSQHLGMLLLQ